MMSNREQMERAVDADPFCTTTEGALADAIQEEGRPDYLAKEIAHVRAVMGRMRVNHKRATELVAKGGPVHTALCVAVLRHVHLQVGQRFTLLVEEGCREPERCGPHAQPIGAFWDEWTVTVGAEWVLRWHDKHQDKRLSRLIRAAERGRKKGPNPPSR